MAIPEIFFFVCVAGAAPGTPNYMCRQHEMPDMETCVQASATFRTSASVAPSDRESRVFSYCAPAGEWAKEKGKK